MMDCDLCGAKMSTEVFTNGKSTWQKCSECESEYVTPDMAQLNAAINKLKMKGIEISVNVGVNSNENSNPC